MLLNIRLWSCLCLMVWWWYTQVKWDEVVVQLPAVLEKLLQDRVRDEDHERPWRTEDETTQRKCVCSAGCIRSWFPAASSPSSLPLPWYESLFHRPNFRWVSFNLNIFQHYLHHVTLNQWNRLSPPCTEVYEVNVCCSVVVEYVKAADVKVIAALGDSLTVSEVSF